MAAEAPLEAIDQAAISAAEADAARAAGDRVRAYDTANKSINRGLRHPLLFMLRGQNMEEKGHFQFALEDYERALKLAPRDRRILDAVAVCALRVGAIERAIAAYDGAIALEPNEAELHHRRGLALSQSGDSRAAEAAYEAALALNSEFTDALASLALLVARRGDADGARWRALRALPLAPRHVTARVALAQAELSARRFVEAELALAPLVSGGMAASDAQPAIFSMLGDALDGQQRYAGAFEAYAKKNRAVQNLQAAPSGSAIEDIRHFIAFFENEEPARWRAPDAGGGVENAAGRHVFLLGFMRSGTTLLQQVLAVHGDVTVLEERGLLGAATQKYLTSQPALEMLADLRGDELLCQRRSYWERAREHVPDLFRKLLLDKHPLNTQKLPLIAKLFPAARIILAVRDPRDVVLSCFRRNLRITATQQEFLTPESCARYYAATMRLAEVYREKLSLNLLVHRYEDMIREFDVRVRAICEFIGIEWMEAMRKFDENAPAPGLLSPSAQQVRRPLFDDSIGHWRNYREQLKPVLPILEPWVEKFGYPKD